MQTLVCLSFEILDFDFEFSREKSREHGGNCTCKLSCAARDEANVKFETAMEQERQLKGALEPMKCRAKSKQRCRYKSIFRPPTPARIASVSWSVAARASRSAFAADRASFLCRF